MRVPAILSSCLLLAACAELASEEEEGAGSELGAFESGIGEVSTRSLAQVVVGAGAERVEMTFANAASGVAGCGEAGIYCVDVTLTSRYAAHELRSLTVSLDKLTPLGTVAANGSSRPAYLPSKVRDDLGLWVYGDLAPGASKTRQWRFHWTGGRVAVGGKLFADVVPVGALAEASCTNGSDDDGDRKLDCADADCTGDAACCNGDPDVCADEPTVVQVATGWRHTCALLSTGTVRCWGWGAEGQLGHASQASVGDDEIVPSAGDVDLGGAAVQVVAGEMHTCAILVGGTVRCWGSGAWGQLGGGNTANVGDDESPGSVGTVDVGGNVTQLALGTHATCAVLDTGALRCWGSGYLGYDGFETIGDDETPASAGDVSVGAAVVQVATGHEHACVLLESGSVQCWGQAESGKLGYPGQFPVAASTAGDVELGGLAVQVVASGMHTCALLASGAVRCWGNNGVLGYPGLGTIGDDETPAVAGDVDVGGTVLELAANPLHTCALVAGGAVRCWGWGFGGRLGYGNTLAIGDGETPASAGDVPVGDRAVSLGLGSSGSHTCVVTDRGTVRCWGSNGDGQLGYGHTNDIGDDETPASAGDVPVF